MTDEIQAAQRLSPESFSRQHPASIPVVFMSVLSLAVTGTSICPAAIEQTAYLKASNARPRVQFGNSTSIAGDTLVVGARYEDTAGTESGAAYVFRNNGNNWVQEAYLKASNVQASDTFGQSVAISGDWIVVGAPEESSAANGVGGNQGDNSEDNSGAVYVFQRSGSDWIQTAYIKASNTKAQDQFGYSVAISGDTLVVGAPYQDGGASGVNGDESDFGKSNSGAAYVFVRSGNSWAQKAYLKPSRNTAGMWFGSAVSISGDQIAVSAPLEDGKSPGINGDESQAGLSNSGAVYLFRRGATGWVQEAYIKASNPGSEDRFGTGISISGNHLIVGSYFENSNATGVNGIQSNESAGNSGAAYVFSKASGSWVQEAYLKATNTGGEDLFGFSVGISENTAVVGAYRESGDSIGIGGEDNDRAQYAGAAYLYRRIGNNWVAADYIKASNTQANDYFGYAVAIDGRRVVIGACWESSASKGINQDQSNNGAYRAGAAYVFEDACTDCFVLSLVRARSSDVSLRVAGIPKLGFTLQSAPQLQGPWSDLRNSLIPDSGSIEFGEVIQEISARYYRVVAR